MKTLAGEADVAQTPRRFDEKSVTCEGVCN